ncbi:MAG: universal stress protein [Halohasta sp.]
MPSRDHLLTTPVVPIADAEDAAATYEALVDHIAPADCRPLVMHVVGDDEADEEARRGREALARFTSLADDDGMIVETELCGGDPIAETIIGTAESANASAIVFCSRGGSAWFDLLAGGVRTSLLAKSDTPVVMLPVNGR